MKSYTVRVEARRRLSPLASLASKRREPTLAVTPQLGSYPILRRAFDDATMTSPRY